MRNDCNESIKLWLYLDMSLPPDEKEKFEGHLKECAHCGSLYNEYAEAMELYRKSSVETVSENDFDSMLSRAVSVKKRRKNYITEILDEFLTAVLRHKARAALGAAVIISAIVVSSLIQPDKAVMPEKTFPAEEVLVWTSESQAAEAAEIKNTIEYIAEEDEEKYILQNFEEDALTVALYDFDKDLIAIEEEIDQYNF